MKAAPEQAVEQAAAVEPVEPWWPAWAPWVLWPLVLAVAVVAATEPVKWALYKASWAPFRKVWARQKSHYRKAQLLMPWKALLGALGGWLLFRSGGLFDSGLPAAALGGAVGVFSFTLYDGTAKVLRSLPSVVRARLGTPDDRAATDESRDA